MNKNLKNARIAILVADGFEQIELMQPKQALEEAGARTDIVSPEEKEVRGWNHIVWGHKFPVDVPLGNAKSADYDALVLPGGVMNPDKLRMNERAVQFIREFFEAGKPVSAICHGPWTLIEANVVRGRTMTSWPSLKTDLRNAGARWVDDEVIVDNGLVTSRKPDDIPAFNQKMIQVFAEGMPKAKSAAAGA